mgnify:FL=1
MLDQINIRHQSDASILDALPACAYTSCSYNFRILAIHPQRYGQIPMLNCSATTFIGTAIDHFEHFDYRLVFSPLRAVNTALI